MSRYNRKDNNENRSEYEKYISKASNMFKKISGIITSFVIY